MSDEAKPVHVEPQPTAAKQAEREQMVAGARRLEAAFRAERDAEQSARAERESGAAEPARPTPAPKQPATPKPAAPTSTVSERRAAREEHRREVEAARYQAAQLEQYARQIQPDAQNYQNAKAAWASRDFDRLAELVGAESFDNLVTERIKTLANPSHAQVLEIERQIRERDERERRAQQEHAARVQAHQQQVAQAQYKQRMAAEAQRSSNSIIRTFANAPAFIEALFEARGAHYQRTGEELALERCLDIPRANGLSIVQEMENFGMTADVYRRARGTTTQEKAEPAKPKPAPKSKAEPEQHWGWRPDKKRDADAAWSARATREMERAIGEERRRERR